MKLELMQKILRKEEKIVNKIFLIKAALMFLKIITLGLPNLINRLEQKIITLEDKEK